MMVVMVVIMVAMFMALAQPELLLPPDVVEDWRPAGWANVIASPLPWTPPDLYCLGNTSMLCLNNTFDKNPYLKILPYKFILWLHQDPHTDL